MSTIVLITNNPSKTLYIARSLGDPMSNSLKSESGLKTLINAQNEEFRLVQISPPVITFKDVDPVDELPGEDNANDRDHFSDDIPDTEIDDILQAFNNDYTRKTGRFEVPDPDVDPDNWDDDE